MYSSMDYLNTEDLFETAGGTPLPLNLDRVTAKARTVGTTKAVSLGKSKRSGQFYAYRLGHHRTFDGLTRRDTAVRELAPTTTNEPFPQAFERFLGEKGKIPVLHIQGAGK